MVLVYSQKKTNRLEYVCGLLLGSLLKVNWELTNKLEDFKQYDGPKISYTLNNTFPDALHIPANGFLLERGVHYFEPDIQWRNELPLLFPSKDDKGVGFDPFAACFYLVSRYEEYLPHKKDKFGRFEAQASFAFKNNFLQIPVVNHYAEIIKKALKEKYPSFVFPGKTFSFVPTYDIDIAYAYRGRGLFRSTLGVFRSISELKFGELVKRFRVITGKEQDPFDTYDYQLALSKEHGIKAFYFFLLGDYGQYDKNIAFYSRSLYALIKKIGDYAHVGLHPSFASNDDYSLLHNEANRLRNILNEEVFFSRQHFLKLNLPQTYQNLLKENIKHDFTMGYASQPGFRAGICSPFYFYDLEAEKKTPLRILPVTVMDGSLKAYLKLSADDARSLLFKLLGEVEKVGGAFVSLWHNDALCDCGEWLSWKSVYDDLFRMAAEKHQKTYDPLLNT